MRLSRWPACLLGLFLIATACSNGSTELVVKGAGPDGCEYSGPPEISRGTIELLASSSGLGHIVAMIYEIHSPPAESVSNSELGSVVATVESENEVNLARRSEELAPGHYAIRCVYGEFDGIVGLLTVTS
jgi:hypothetical protein